MPAPSAIIRSKFPHIPTPGQDQLFTDLDDFFDKNGPEIFLIKGYAGTGKTTVISVLTRLFPLFNYKYVLLAPTGRAAKVISSYADRMAFTIHRKIYKTDTDENQAFRFRLQKNYAKNTVFVVDEASMIGHSWPKNSLLKDLISFVFQDSSNKLMLIGDTAQLPPVGQVESPALSVDLVEELSGGCRVAQALLEDVTRQAEESGILLNATQLRQYIGAGKRTFNFDTSTYPDIFRMTSDRLEDGLRYAYDKFGQENTCIICRSNKQANFYNQYIRRQLHFYENELEAGEIIMVVRNNYLYGETTGKGGFIANGDFAEVRKIITFEDRYDLRFAKLELKLLDYPEETAFEAMVMLDTLYDDGPNLNEEKNSALYKTIREETADLSRKEQKEAMKSNPYLNALQIKFAYALTCHKSQGGQWDAVFIDKGYVQTDQLDDDFLRWLYTAITRAKSELYLVNFERTFFVN